MLICVGLPRIVPHCPSPFPRSLPLSRSNCDPNNPNVWCSLGVLYYQLHQNRDALDAYTRAIKLDPHLCEVCVSCVRTALSGQLCRMTAILLSCVPEVETFRRCREPEPAQFHPQFSALLVLTGRVH